MNVSACIVTRGDVDLSPILDSLLLAGFEETIIWDNSKAEDLAVYGRYAAIEHARGELIYVQDDDCVVSDPAKLVSHWVGSASLAGPVPADGSDLANIERGDHVVCNMPQEFRHSFYEEHALVGFGAVFHREAPQRAFARFFGSDTGNLITRDLLHYYRCCDVAFTALTPRVLVDVPVESLPWAVSENRMYRQPEHVAERTRMLELVRSVRG